LELLEPGCVELLPMLLLVLLPPLLLPPVCVTDELDQGPELLEPAVLELLLPLLRPLSLSLPLE